MDIGRGTVGDKCSAILYVNDSIDEPCEERLQQVECELVSEMTSDTVRLSAEREKVLNQYKIGFQPVIKGKHQLHVKIDGQHIKGSPYSIAVTSPVEKLGTPIFSIHGESRLWGVAIGKMGEIVVSEFDHNCISVFGPHGEKLRSFGTRGTGQGQFDSPRGVAASRHGGKHCSSG